MFFENTSEEKEELDRIEAEYEQQVRELDAKILALRPDDPEPPKEPIEALRSKVRALLDKLPEDTKSAEYKRLQSQINRYNNKIASINDEWYEAGSEEWKAARVARNRIDREMQEIQCLPGGACDLERIMGAHHVDPRARGRRLARRRRRLERRLQHLRHNRPDLLAPGRHLALPQPQARRAGRLLRRRTVRLPICRRGQR